MKTPLLLGALLTLAILPARAGNPRPGDPAELTALCDRHETALWQATAPLITEHVKALVLLEDRFTKAGNAHAAIAVENELNKVLASLRGSGHPHHVPVVNIISATYRQVEDHSHAVDTTAILKKAFDSGAPHLRLTTQEGAAGKDPSYNQKKETVIAYTSDGQKKEIIIPEAGYLTFRKDLK